jgi:hypothetical protein
MKIFINLTLFCIVAAISCGVYAQQPLYLNQYKTPQNTLPITGYYQIGGYKVKGNPFYKPDFILGDFYSAAETAKSIYLRYDIYNQKVEFVSSANKDQILVKEPGDLDSFVIYKKENKVIIEDIKMVYATFIGAADKYYYCPLHKGEKYSLYKKYVSELVVPLDRTGSAESRVFETQVQYWYVDERTKAFKKVNGTVAAVKKEFKDIKDLSDVLKGGSMFKNPDEAMIKAFVYLNE